MKKYLPVQVSGDSIEDFGAVLVLFPLRRVELQHRFVHQIFTTLNGLKSIFKAISKS